MSILDSIKKMLGLDADYNAFDTDVIVDINSALMVLNQIGVGKNGFIVTGRDETWEDLLGSSDYEGAKTFVYLKTRLLFDPPSNSFTIDAIEKQIDELSWRLQALAIGGEGNDGG